jgi:excisionase family DNA binding protein
MYPLWVRLSQVLIESGTGGGIRTSALDSDVMIDVMAKEQSTEWLRVQAACAYMKIGKTTFYELCKLGGLRHVKVANKILTKQEWIDEWLEGQAVENRFS